MNHASFDSTFDIQLSYISMKNQENPGIQPRHHQESWSRIVSKHGVEKRHVAKHVALESLLLFKY